MKPFRIYLELEEAKVVRDLRARLAAAEEQAVKDASECRLAVMLMRAECDLNSELIEICRQHDLPIRERLDLNSERRKQSRAEFSFMKKYGSSGPADKP